VNIKNFFTDRPAQRHFDNGGSLPPSADGSASKKNIVFPLIVVKSEITGLAAFISLDNRANAITVKEYPRFRHYFVIVKQ
jgi:hypothetical protein